MRPDTKIKKNSLAEEMEQHVKKGKVNVTKSVLDGDFRTRVSTGSTLLDLAISGGRIAGGGLPGGILVEAFGPQGSGKTVILCQIAGACYRKGGQVIFKDPEARLNKQFARMFGMDKDKIAYDTPNTVIEAFDDIRKFEPKAPEKPNGVFIDSLAALSTDMELEDKDKTGMRRGKEFSETLRKVCRTITATNLLVVCSNQVRDNIDAGPYGEKTVTPGGRAVPFYSSVRLKFSSPKKIKVKKTVHSREVERVIGTQTMVEVYKNSVWKPYRVAPLTIIFDYGIDDTRDSLTYLKQMGGSSVYTIGERKLDKSIDKSIAIVEEENLEKELRREVIRQWNEEESLFSSNRKVKYENE